jgi:hypothetical protein
VSAITEAPRRKVAQRMAGSYALGELAREDECLGSSLERRRRRLGELLREPLRDAKAAGTLRRDLTIDDVFLVVSMIKGAVARADSAGARAAAASRGLALVLDGLSRSRTLA